MEMDPHDRDSDIGDDSPMSHNEEELSDPEADGELHDGEDSCDEGTRSRQNNSISLVHPDSLHHPADVLAKLKMQVRDLKEREELEHLQLKSMVSNGGGSVTPISSMMGGGNNPLLATPPNSMLGATTNGVGGGNNGMGAGSMGIPVSLSFPAFPTHPGAAFLPPLAPPPAPPSSGGSSHSSEGSASSQHASWSFEEQFKQVRQLYEINDDPKRKEFLDDLFSYMQKRGTPINRLPIMAKSVLDLYELYNLVVARGGLVDVINKKLWQEIIKGLHLPSSITSAAFTLRTQYMKYLYPYECEKRRLSTPAELQAAIDGNRREGRRTSYTGGGYAEHLVQQHHARSPAQHAQMSPLALVSGVQHHHRLGNGALHPSHPPPPQLGQPPQMLPGPIPGMAPAEFEARMVEYVKLLNKELRGAASTPPHHRQGSTSPPGNTSPLNPVDVSRLTLWSLYNNNQLGGSHEPQREALNLSETQQAQQQLQLQQQQNSIKREPIDTELPAPPAKRILQDDEMSPSPPSRQMSPVPLTTNIKISNRGDARNGDNSSMVVSMEINGVIYQGVLFAQQSPENGRSSNRITT